jgi:hypothetical protein
MAPRNFTEFWPYYVGEHRNPYCRLLHYIGTSTGVPVGIAGILTLNPLLVGAGFVMGYGPAWIGHFFIENNRPASFKYPLWSFFADLKMLTYAVTGRMGEELARLEKIDFRLVSTAA